MLYCIIELECIFENSYKMTRQTWKHSALCGDLIYDETSSSLFIEKTLYTNMTILQNRQRNSVGLDTYIIPLTVEHNFL